MRVFIIGSAPQKDLGYLKKIDFSSSMIIAADGGLRVCEALGLTPDAWIGDNDSLKREEINAKDTVFLDTHKDKTDVNVCVDYATQKGATHITLLCVTGGRLDHEYGNFAMLKYISQHNIYGEIIDEQNTVLYTDKAITIPKNDREFLSIFPYGNQVKGLTVTGTEYEAFQVDINNYSTLTVSNRIINEAHISFDSGELLIFLSGDKSA
ncbi:MAG: thiamine diphosphokinase [Clostridia bacterium]|nr:thiamine diphosphokinase [Clostridia bacterium]